jgi:hypothetical protein
MRRCDGMYTVSAKSTRGGSPKVWPPRSPDLISVYSVLHDIVLTIELYNL